MQDQPCKRDDLRVELVTNSEVDDDGRPTVTLFTDQDFDINSGVEPWFCVGPCGGNFSTWEDALAHLPKQGAA